MVRNKILVVEDDKTLLDVLKYNLEKENYAVITADDGAKALHFAREQKPDLIILDIMLPQLDGFEVCRILRKEMTIPILMLTAKADEVDRVVGLEIGADDYITKPFSMRELLARVRAALRRSAVVKQEAGASSENEKSVISSGNLKIDIGRHQVTVDNHNIELSPKEFDLLVTLVKNKGKVFNRDSLLEKIWGYEYVGDTRTVDVHIRWLRQKIEIDPERPVRILTVRGLGYKFED